MMNTRLAVIVTTINSPNAALRKLSGRLQDIGELYVIGDKKSPESFHLDGARYYSLEDQLSTGLEFAKACPVNHYARKNVGYLLAIRHGHEIIVETDDDNFPREAFFHPRQKTHSVTVAENMGWVNVYRYFSDSNIWPRGFPLDQIHQPLIPIEELPEKPVICPIQQGLADENPDVDAIYRLLFPLPQSFRRNLRLALKGKSWCPFNSQNTTWFKEAFPLLYLPARCSFRMTDIWRSLVAQRISAEYGWGILFHEASVWQDRNYHNLMKDFEDEIPGYLKNRAIVDELCSVSLDSREAAIDDNLRLCYTTLVNAGYFDRTELGLLEIWLEDYSRCINNGF